MADEKTCAFLCAPHLRACQLERGHKDDCWCGDRLCTELREAEARRWEQQRLKRE